jgi:DNA uptake protein ComE-like DNA-binding protein
LELGLNVGLLMLSATAFAQTSTSTQLSPDSPNTDTQQTGKIDQLLGQLYPPGLPGQPAAVTGGTSLSTAVNPTSGTVQMVIRRPAAQAGAAQSPDEPAIDLSLLDTTSTTQSARTAGASKTTSGSTLRPLSTVPTLPPLLNANATPQTPLPQPTATIVPPASAPGVKPAAGITPAPTPAVTPAAPKPLTRKVHVNHAGEQELMAGLGIDARRARMIIEFRQIYGMFHSPDDLDQVTGLPDDMVRRWEEAGILAFD